MFRWRRRGRGTGGRQQASGFRTVLAGRWGNRKGKMYIKKEAGNTI